jgi:hypothetical protein
MADAVGWIAQAFKLFGGLIHARGPAQPDAPVVTVAGEDVPPEAAAEDSSASIVRLEVASAADALAPHEEAEIEAAPPEPVASAPARWDDESRRKLIRQLFNDYWTGVEDKPPTFAERLAMAERYINERLADCDVGWRLDAATRKQLGLPG